MRVRTVTLIAAALPLCGCVFGVNQLGRTPRAAQAEGPSPSLAAYAAPDVQYPTVGGNVLAGTSPDVQAAARAAAIRPPTPDTP